MRIAVCVIFFAFCSAFIVSGQELKQSKKNAQNTLSEEDTIREIIFREILPKSQTANSEKARIDVCLSVNNGKDPSADLLNKLSDYPSKNKLNLKKADACFVYSEGGIILDYSNLKGTVFYVSNLSWFGKDKVRAEAGSYSGNIGGNGCMYSLKKTNGSWKIISAIKCFVA